MDWSTRGGAATRRSPCASPRSPHASHSLQEPPDSTGLARARIWRMEAHGVGGVTAGATPSATPHLPSPRNSYDASPRQPVRDRAGEEVNRRPGEKATRRALTLDTKE